MFTAPLDYGLWQRLNQESLIASRLYEYLLWSFHHSPILQINYETLVRFIPLHPHRYRSTAKRQLEPAFRLLERAGVIERVSWEDSNTGIARLRINCGRRIAASRDQDQPPLPFMDEGMATVIEKKELPAAKSPESSIVVAFYRLWNGDDHRHPSKPELELARQIIEQNGLEKAEGIIPILVKRLRVNWPKAKTFIAIRDYLNEASVAYDREQQCIERDQQEKASRQREEEEREREKVREARFEAEWKPAWQALPEIERESIRKQILQQFPFLKKTPNQVERFCLDELARRRGT